MNLSYKNSANISQEALNTTAQTLQEYSQRLQMVAKKNNYEDPECTINLPFDDALFQKTIALAQKKLTAELKYLLIIGIGGSNLGTKAFYDATYGFYDTIEPKRYPKMIFLDTQNSTSLSKTIALLKTLANKEEILINAISKSGGTTETMANLEVIYAALKEKFGDINDRIVFTTDEGSKMQTVAEAQGIDYLTMPTLVGGRFSVFSAVGQFPLALMGFDVASMRKSAQEMRDRCLDADIDQNPALVSAIILFLQASTGKTINDNFIFVPQLESLGKWYRQLMGESIGKDGKGITPTVSIGSTDLHSVGQLYLGGPKDKVTTFIYNTNDTNTLQVPDETVFKLVPSIAYKKIDKIMNAIIEGTKIAYKNQELPFMEVGLDSGSEASIASFMQFKMMEMMYLGKLFEVNTFDQPHVELYKVETKRILEEK